jgi:putative oxidoreductase
LRIVVLIARIVLGLIFTIFGLNGFLNFIPSPPSIPGNAGAFFGAILASHYVYLVAAAQLVSGVLLLINQYVPLALVILAGVIVNILTFHITMWPQGIFPFPILVTICWFIVAWSMRDHFAPIFARKA